MWGRSAASGRPDAGRLSGAGAMPACIVKCFTDNRAPVRQSSNRRNSYLPLGIRSSLECNGRPLDQLPQALFLKADFNDRQFH
jgi:hypothetical protein